ncbi:MAG: DUF2306 domain-containing protein [Saprospiraceae bacterium]|nr:DUF2306 domain-containing protein [Saprospiraceae bacterium]
MLNKIGWFIFALLCVLISTYPIFYVVKGDSFGLLTSKTAEQLANMVWKTAFYTHIVPGGVALLVGWAQFSKKWRTKRPDIHRLLGKIYVFTALPSALAGIYIGIHAVGGPICNAGFVIGGIIWFYTTLQALLKIKQGDVLSHQKHMIFSYATCFGAVTLRFYLPALIAYYHEFEPAYRIVAWMAWLPNIIVAWWIVNRLEQKNLAIS